MFNKITNPIFSDGKMIGSEIIIPEVKFIVPGEGTHINDYCPKIVVNVGNKKLIVSADPYYAFLEGLALAKSE